MIKSLNVYAYAEWDPGYQNIFMSGFRSCVVSPNCRDWGTATGVQVYGIIRGV